MLASRHVVRNGKVRLRSLEFFLADTCNLKCAHCASSSPSLTRANLPDLKLFERSLSLLGTVLHARQIKFLGGEPLLNKDIARFLSAARRSGVFDMVRVTTNGLLLERASDLFWENVDIVEVSSYPNIPKPLSEGALDRIRTKAALYKANLEVREVAEFSISVSDTPNANAASVRRIYADCAEVGSCPTLYAGRLYRCSRVHTIDARLKTKHYPHSDFTREDGLALDRSSGLFQRVWAYLEEAAPLRACAFCFGTSGKMVEHRQLTSTDDKML